MKSTDTVRKGIATAAVLGLALLAGCMFAPGKFLADLDIRKDGRFTFHYQGEIQVLALSDLATKGGKAVFSPKPCGDEDDDGASAERTCSAEELKSQKEEWEAEQASAEARRRREAEKMRTMTGGLDPQDPKAAEELAKRLRRQAGYRSVEYKGNGLYVVDFLASSSLTHGFAFPAFEGFPLTNAFVLIAPRNDGTIRIDAPGFVPSTGGSLVGSMMMEMMAKEGEKAGQKWSAAEGTFTLATDAQILSSNTDEGPQADARGQKLAWTVNSLTTSAPMALLRLAPR